MMSSTIIVNLCKTTILRFLGSGVSHASGQWIEAVPVDGHLDVIVLQSIVYQKGEPAELYADPGIPVLLAFVEIIVHARVCPAQNSRLDG